MNRPRRIVWIDDNPSRETSAGSVQALLRVRVDFRNVKGQDLFDELGKILDGPIPFMVILDHILDKTAAPSNNVLRTGTPVAEALRNRWPACPIVGVTAAKNRENIDAHEEAVYDELFSFQDFSHAMPCLGPIARGFARLAQGITDSREFLEILKTPDEDTERLTRVIPDDLKRNFRDTSFASRAYAWVRRVLVQQPGFLYDQLWAATFLGIKCDSFDKVASMFNPARYRGIFALPDSPRWWASSLAEILYGRCHAEPGKPSWLVGRNLPGTGPRDYSVCYACKKLLPETVGFLDVISEQQRPMHLRCTAPHPRFARQLFFAEARMMMGAN